MTRYTICEEGHHWLPNQFILPGALKWDDDKKYPIFINNDSFNDPPAGIAWDLNRDENNVVTAEVEWIKGSSIDEFGLLSGEGLTVYAQGVDWGHDDDGRRDGTVKSAELKGLFIAEVPWGVRDEN